MCHGWGPGKDQKKKKKSEGLFLKINISSENKTNHTEDCPNVWWCQTFVLTSFLKQISAFWKVLKYNGQCLEASKIYLVSELTLTVFFPLVKIEVVIKYLLDLGYLCSHPRWMDGWIILNTPLNFFTCFLIYRTEVIPLSSQNTERKPRMSIKPI